MEEARDIGASFGELAIRAKKFSGTPIHVHAILSPVSGFFRHPSLVQEALTWLRMVVLDRAAAVEPHPQSRVTVHVGRYKGHPKVFVEEILESLVLKEGIAAQADYHVILSLGGDGTHQEILQALVEAPAELIKRFIVFRIPLGTGNDGADVNDLSQAAKLLLEAPKLEAIPALRIEPRYLPPTYAFNIASIGIDAFVTHSANKLKHTFNTDIYKKIADASVLLYPFVFPTRTMELRLSIEGKGEEIVVDRFVLAAFGVTGHRSYGNHKWILPGDENLCAIVDRSLRQKLIIKNLIYQGKHAGQRGVLLKKCREVTLIYDSPLYLNFDGETLRLEKENFPCRMEVVSTNIRTLQP